MQKMHMLKEVYSTHTIASCHKICTTENCKMKNKCLVPLLSDVWGGKGECGVKGFDVHISLCHVSFCNVCGHDRSTLLFIFYAKYSVEKTWAALNLLAFASLFYSGIPRRKKIFHVFINLFRFFLLLLKCKTCTNLNLFCSVAKLYDSGHFIEEGKKNTPHILPVYSLAVFWLPFSDIPLPPSYFLYFSLASCGLYWYLWYFSHVSY